MEMRKVLILGGTSAIGEQVARRLAAAGAALYLTGRDADRLERSAADLRVRGATQVETERLDVAETPRLTHVVGRALDALDGLDTVLFAAGLLRETLEINAISAMLVLNEAAVVFAHQGHGQLVAIGSVAGDRGRAANSVYGAAKGALEIFMSGLRQRLQRHGVRVLLVKPGFVDTPMTSDLAKGPLWASPDRVAHDIIQAMDRGRSVIYTPWFWRWIMLIIRHIPEGIFKRLSF